jgi:alpha-D-ribose 1-methylphosphonate 5-phosphate C-P lyase
MGVFLKTIGSGRNPCPEPYARPYADFSHNPRQVKPGDHLVLYAAGGRKCVFAIAEVTSEVKASEFDDWPYRVDLNYLVRLHPADGVPIDEVSIDRDLSRSIGQHTYIVLHSEEYERARAKLEEAAAGDAG